MNSGSIQAAIAGLTIDQLEVRADYAVAGLVIYDYILTLSEEQKHIWKGGRTLIFYLFIGVRYGNLFALVCNCLMDTLPLATDEECGTVKRISDALDLVASLSLSGIFVLRAYAVWNKRLSVLLGLGTLALGKAALSVLEYIFSDVVVTQGVTRQYAACSAISRNAAQDLPLANEICVMVFESCVLVLTVAKTMQQVIRCRKLGIRQSLSSHVLRDGLLYFIAVEAWIVCQIVLQNVSLSSMWVSNFSAFEQAVASIVAQRLLLNLRQVQDERNNPIQVSANLDELDFGHGSIIGNIGAPLRAMDDEDGDNAREAPRVDEDGEGETMEADEMAIEQVRRSV